MKIDISRVITDEHRDAMRRLTEGNVTKDELAEVLQQLPTKATSLSMDQYERLSQLAAEGRVEQILTESVTTSFSLNVVEAIILGRIYGRLDGLNNLPDQMAALETIAQTEMASEVAYIESSIADTFPLPTREIVRVYSAVLTEKYECLETEFNLKKALKERKEALGTCEFKAEYDLTQQQKLLAEICPLFRDATPEIQKQVWRRLGGFTRTQWALFIIETNPTKKRYSSKAEAINRIIKPSAKAIEEISGLTNMRGVSIVESSEQHNKDVKRVHEIVNILKSAAVLLKEDLLPLTET